MSATDDRLAEIRAERDRAREECGHEKAMRAHAVEERDRFIRLYRDICAEATRLAAVVERVQKLAESAPVVAVHVGAGNLVDRRPMVDALNLTAALNEGDET